MSASASPEWVAECTAKEEESAFDSTAEIDCRLREEEKERERVNGRTRKSKNVMPFLSPEHRLRPTGLLSPLTVPLHFFPSASSAAAVCIPPYKWLSARCTQYSAHQCWWWWSKRLLLLYHLPVIYTHSLTHSLTAVQQWSTNEESGCTATRYGMCMAPSACSTTHTDTFFCLPVFNFVYTALSLSLFLPLSQVKRLIWTKHRLRDSGTALGNRNIHTEHARDSSAVHTHIDTAWHCTANNIKKKSSPMTLRTPDADWWQRFKIAALQLLHFFLLLLQVQLSSMLALQVLQASVSTADDHPTWCISSDEWMNDFFRRLPPLPTPTPITAFAMLDGLIY